jgi:H/ACA ribonucleoprotein complex subunit 4
MSAKVPKVKKHKKVRTEDLEDEIEDVDREVLEGDIIHPSKEGPRLDTANWPLLLKNYEKMSIRTSHYTPIPAGAVTHMLTYRRPPLNVS